MNVDEQCAESLYDSDHAKGARMAVGNLTIAEEK
jgi:hypothetical protein